jgi:small subunit ribosomal protein S14
MFNSIKRDLKRRKLYKKYESKRLLYKALLNDCNLSQDLRYILTQKLNELPRNSSRIRLKNRCILTGRSHSVYKFCRISRIKFRDLVNQGSIPGYVKSSW